MKKTLPVICPSCNSGLKVNSLHCEKCETTINGLFELPVLLQLSPQEQDFILNFVISSGSLKVMATQLKLSYPTVRNMLDDLIDKIKKLRIHD
jgi:hypothetical protein